MNKVQCDIVISGAGPAGATLALMLAGSGLKIILLDKDLFPRGKVCGDALSGQVVSILKRMPGNLYREFHATVPKTPSYGIRFVSPDLHSIGIPFPGGTDGEPAGYICQRKEFDSFLISAVRKQQDILFLEGEQVENIELKPEGVLVTTSRSVISGRMVAGADGVHSVVRDLLAGGHPEKSRLSTGIRAYFNGVTGFQPGGYIELWFLRELLPFYFWIFPGTGGLCNAGLALPRGVITKKKIILAKELERIVRTHPAIAPRFAAAEMAGKPEAHSLPLAMPAGPFSGSRFILLGDAASLVDPFTGEGIGNAMASAEVAARVIRVCAERGDFSGQVLKEYDRQILRRMDSGLRTSRWLHRLARYPLLLDRVIGRAERNRTIREIISVAFYDEKLRKKLAWRLLMGKQTPESD